MMVPEETGPSAKPATASSRKYRAFISYSHTDRSWGEWLHRALETYRVPKRLVGRATNMGTVPRRIAPVFRDREELPTATSLGAVINEALQDSATLVVICSPAAARSRWVNEEILTYKRLGRGDRILALIVAGEPNSSDKADDGTEECFPEALRYRTGPDGELTSAREEPVAADLRPGGDGKAAAKLKLVAGILGVGYDELRQREQQRRFRRLVAVTAASVAGVLIAAALTVDAMLARQEAEAERARAEAALDESEAVTDFLTSMLGAASPAEQGRDVTVREVLDQAANRLEVQFAEQPLLEARMLHTLASTYGALGYFDVAKDQFEKAYGIRSERLGPVDPETLESRRDLASTLVELEQRDAATAELREMLALERQVFGPDHPGTLKTQASLGVALVRADELVEAEALLQDGLERAETALGPDSPETLMLMNGLSNIHWQRRELEPMMALNTRILEATRGRYGDLHPDTVSAIHNLATAYFLASDRLMYSGEAIGNTPALQHAAELYAEASAKGKALYGEDHPSPYISQFMYGVCRLNIGEYDAAEQAFHEVVRARERLSGPDSQGVFSPKGQLARLYIRQKRFEEARDLMAGVVEGAVRVLGEEHTATQVYRYRLGIALMHLEAYEEAESVLLNAHGHLLEARGADHDWTQWSAKVLSELYERLDRPEEARQWMDRVDPEWNAAMEEVRAQNTAPFYD
ncbi:MAG: toll/interleukin-1 receptor domain-containing protein [Gammaproteobacteria bacterium]